MNVEKPPNGECTIMMDNGDTGSSPSKVRHVPVCLGVSVTGTPPGIKSSDISPQETNSDKKKRIRRKHKGGRHHRKWKPYTKLSWHEKKMLEEKEGRKAAQKREERLASGQPMAPYNTTQFLMDIHDPDAKYEEMDSKDSADHIHVRARRHSVSGANRDGSASVESSDEYYSSPDDEEIFLEKEFSVDYENYHAEHLESLSKDALVREYLEMERKCERLERERTDAISTEPSDVKSTETSDITTKQAEEMVRKLRAENEQLRRENEELCRVNTELRQESARAENKENDPDT